MKQASQVDLLTSLMTLRKFMSPGQVQAMMSFATGEEGEFYRAKITELANMFNTMPHTYQQDGKGDQAVAYLRYFLGRGTWHITEKDMGKGGQHQAFGLADIGFGGELGYISIVELIQMGAELDLYYTPKTLEKIREEEFSA